MRQRFLTFNSCDLDRLLLETRTCFFPQIDLPVQWEFQDAPTLARLICDDSSALIIIHQVLNHSDTPPEVFSMIFKHELLHLSFRDQATEWETPHSPIFWEAEKRITPELGFAWDWIRSSLRSCIRFDKQAEQTKVTKRWKRLMT